MGTRQTFEDFIRKSNYDKRKRKTKQRRRSNDEHSAPDGSKVPQEKGTRLGGSTTTLLPEPRADKVSGIDISHTPPTQEPDFF